MHRLPAIGLACLVAFVAGCGGDNANDNPSTVSTPPPAAASTTKTGAASSGATVAVTIKDIKFMPHDITAKVGQKIVWTNNDDIPHNVTATGGADFASDTLQKDATFEYTPTKAGKIDYVCTIHAGQDGTITVTK